MTINIQITKARNKANLPVGRLSDTELVDAGNAAQDKVAQTLLEADEAYFDFSSAALGWLANTEELDLPRPIASRKITKVTRTDLTLPRDLWPIRFQEKNLYESVALEQGMYYYLRGEKLGLKPTPKSTIAANILINYQQLPHELHHAQIKTPTFTTFIMPTATSVTPYMKAGRVRLETDYYVNARIRIISGAQTGMERRISAFNAATQTATIDTAWTAGEVTDVTNADYVILSPLAQEYQHAIYWAMVMEVGIKSERVSLQTWGERELDKIVRSALENAEPRNIDIGRYVRPPADFDL